MSVHSDFETVVPFSVRTPATQTIPFLFNSPHSGRHYPRRFIASSRLDADGVRRSEDVFVDELFAGVVALGAPLMMAHFPRAYLDVNREPYELDPRMFSGDLPAGVNSRSPRVAGGLGTVPRIVAEGQPIYREKLPAAEALERIEALYMPYHDLLSTMIERTFDRFGQAILVDCHSMPSTTRFADAGPMPDIIIGDRFGTACHPSLADYAIQLLRDGGFRVAHNRPYAGGFITERYGRPALARHAFQIEINRALYLDEKTYSKTRDFDALSDAMGRFVRELSRLPAEWMRATPAAAE
ncbi:N-formylglutamate amidohydrolase [Notoacmeibacter sp. MSK16QG-6]|uniref:N-formylglutamate amidohydrolase n=1 Tax=Notoacmeibacter sp. MSK16QG-6 TaxID=2957982 RepID=UPI00209F06EB|nr:N-formylglutamate amidohydrolase [Notoacmeibacter sp. MSK16QG-6]MCP1200356.1 N-formylglutamate amidohydrolase [Notoacmeibacter sp. MSK16QG-6]